MCLFRRGDRFRKQAQSDTGNDRRHDDGQGHVPVLNSDERLIHSPDFKTVGSEANRRVRGRTRPFLDGFHWCPSWAKTTVGGVLSPIAKPTVQVRADVARLGPLYPKRLKELRITLNHRLKMMNHDRSCRWVSSGIIVPQDYRAVCLRIRYLLPRSRHQLKSVSMVASPRREPAKPSRQRGIQFDSGRTRGSIPTRPNRISSRNSRLLPMSAPGLAGVKIRT